MRIAIYTYIILCITLFSSCYKVEIEDYVPSPNNRTESAEQTTIMYFMGTDLSYFYNNYNMSAVKRAVKLGALGRHGRLLVFMPTNSYDATLYEIYQLKYGEYSTKTLVSYKDLTPKHSLTKSRVSEVIEYVKENIPSKTYNIIFSGHGTGWVKQTHPYLSSINSMTINSIWDKEEGAAMTRFMGCSSDGYMEISELREGLESTQTKFGYLLFDMCFMSNIETLYELKDMSHNIVASPAEVMAAGFPYDTVMPELFSNGGTTYDLNGACNAFYQYYKSYSYPSGTATWCVTSFLDDLSESVKNINTAGINSVNINNLLCYERLSEHVFCDFGNYIKEACNDATLYDKFKGVLDNCFPVNSRCHTTSYYSALSGASGWTLIDNDKYTGVSTSDASSKYQDEWAQTSWAVATQVD